VGGASQRDSEVGVFLEGSEESCSVSGGKVAYSCDVLGGIAECGAGDRIIGLSDV